MTQRLSLALAAFLGLAISLVSYRFVAVGLQPAFPNMMHHIDGARLAFTAHVAAAPVALALGAFQFMPWLRARARGLHRLSGRVYAAAILIGGLGSLGMVPTSAGGAAAQIGFGLLAVLWLAFTANAVRHAMARRFEAHRAWMTRSYALTFAGVTLRLYLAPMLTAGMVYDEAIVILAWACWVPNLLVAEWLLRRRMGVMA